MIYKYNYSTGYLSIRGEVVMLSERTMNLVSAWTSCSWCSIRGPTTLHCSLTRCRGRPWPRHNTLHRGHLSANLSHFKLSSPQMLCIYFIFRCVRCFTMNLQTRSPSLSFSTIVILVFFTILVDAQ